MKPNPTKLITYALLAMAGFVRLGIVRPFTVKLPSSSLHLCTGTSQLVHRTACRGGCRSVQFICSDGIHQRFLPFNTKRSPRCLVVCSSFSSDGEVGDTTVISAASDRDDEAEVLMEPEDFATLPEGKPKGFYVVKQYQVLEQFDWDGLVRSGSLTYADVDRLSLTPSNVSLPVALMILDPDEYPSLSRARKVCRKGNILLHKGALSSQDRDNNSDAESICLSDRCIRGRVIHRVEVDDVIAKQVRIGSGYFPVLAYKKPPFEVPVVYQDDYCALVNKPSGVVVYNQRNGGHGTMTIRAALPFVLNPPKAGTYNVMRRPTSVHRLDKPTSGLLCIAKTKSAMVAMSQQFHDRIVKKTYMAVINGLPICDRTITSQEAFDMGVDVDPETDDVWHLVDKPLDDKSAVTIWRPLRYEKSLHAHDGYLTLVELKPKTGRYHQLRRHMAWTCERPLVGDNEYDKGTESAMKFRERGLFLASTKIRLEHPFYNTEEGRLIWRGLNDEQRHANGMLWHCEVSDKVMMSASVDLPDKFDNLLQRESDRFEKFKESAAT